MKRFFAILSTLSISIFLLFPFTAFANEEVPFVWAKNEIPNEKDILNALNIDMSHYAGKYIKDGVLHIKIVINQQNISEAIKDIMHFHSVQSIAFQQYFNENIVIEYDALYNLEYLEKVIDTVTYEQLEQLSIHGMGIKISINGFSVFSTEWTESKKQQTAELLGVDSSHIEFKISSGIFIDD